MNVTQSALPICDVFRASEGITTVVSLLQNDYLNQRLLSNDLTLNHASSFTEKSSGSNHSITPSLFSSLSQSKHESKSHSKSQRVLTAAEEHALAERDAAHLAAPLRHGHSKSCAIPHGHSDEHQPAGRGELRGDRSAGRRGGAGADDSGDAREANRVLFGVHSCVLSSRRELQSGGSHSA